MMTNNESVELEESKTTKKSTVTQNIISRFSRGNVNLQKGRYLTQEVQNARKKTLDQYDFLS